MMRVEKCNCCGKKFKFIKVKRHCKTKVNEEEKICNFCFYDNFNKK